MMGIASLNPSYALIRSVGGEAFDEVAQTTSLSPSLPINDPEPVLVYPGSIFVVAGTFSFGARKLVTKEKSRGGELGAAPSRKTRFVVVGELRSRDWLNTNAGTKIQKAVELRGDGHPLTIVSEAHWVRSLV
nr:hypothetical protein [uncultured Pseudoxanthomonas sp.]